MSVQPPAGTAPAAAAPLLRAGDDGYVYSGTRALALPPKEQAVLHLLLTRSPSVVSKDEFAERVWPGQDMSDDSLTRCIHHIRHTLHKMSGYCSIDTLYGRGYRLTMHSAEAAVPAMLAAHQRLLSATQAPPHLVEAFMHARQLALQRTPAAMAQAEQILRDTIAQAPEYAAARVALAECLAGASSWGISSDPGYIDEGLEQLATAERIAPAVAGLHSARAYLLDRAWRFDEAEAAYAQALRDNPDDADTNFHYGWHLLAVDRPDAAREALRTAIRLHPYAVLLRVTLARAHAHAGCPQDALQEMETACRLSPGDEMAELYLVALRAWLQPGPDIVAAAWKLTMSRHALTLAPSILSYALARTGDGQGALDIIDACTRCASANASTNAMHAAALLALGRIDDAIALVQAAAAAHSGTLPILMRDPANIGLKQHPSYPALHARIFGASG